MVISCCACVLPCPPGANFVNYHYCIITLLSLLSFRATPLSRCALQELVAMTPAELAAVAAVAPQVRENLLRAARASLAEVQPLPSPHERALRARAGAAPGSVTVH